MIAVVIRARIEAIKRGGEIKEGGSKKRKEKEEKSTREREREKITPR